MKKKKKKNSTEIIKMESAKILRFLNESNRNFHRHYSNKCLRHFAYKHKEEE